MHLSDSPEQCLSLEHSDVSKICNLYLYIILVFDNMAHMNINDMVLKDQ